MKRTRLGWHVTGVDDQLRYNDRRKAVPGARLKFKGSRAHDDGCQCRQCLRPELPLLCVRGMHASRMIRQALDCYYTALGYMPTDLHIHRVEVEGVGEGERYVCSDKFVGTHRTSLGYITGAQWDKMKYAARALTDSARHRLALDLIRKKNARRSRPLDVR